MTGSTNQFLRFCLLLWTLWFNSRLENSTDLQLSCPDLLTAQVTHFLTDKLFYIPAKNKLNNRGSMTQRRLESCYINWFSEKCAYNSSLHFHCSLKIHFSPGAFVICWTPGLIILLMDGLLGKRSNAMKYEKYCLVIAECNSLVNPIIYSLRDNEMRRTFKWILCCLCQRGVDRQQVSSPIEISSPLTEVTLKSNNHRTTTCSSAK